MLRRAIERFQVKRHQREINAEFIERIERRRRDDYRE